ncbi:hypothetical protein BDN70DRAFT_818798 [Pholiota conissans]|uniref:Uncharacterized protein n=1 Tax=Pholiota conissans TaxID=109636 RepID=A0A9P6CU89_9AGAR|nr:hypothetical protein BDN70DRAFT_818798 [Pholiota conissans]
MVCEELPAQNVATNFASIPPSSVTTIPPPPLEAKPTHSITFADGFVLTITQDEIPPPPAISFVNKYEVLNAMWDDKSEYWKGFSHLVIRGCHIPIVYWKEGNVSNYKILVDAMRESSIPSFLEEYTENGALLSYTTILDKLRRKRIAESERLAALAREEFGSRFNEVFGYKKGGKWVPKQTALDIAKQYSEMKGLPAPGSDESD